SGALRFPRWLCVRWRSCAPHPPCAPGLGRPDGSGPVKYQIRSSFYDIQNRCLDAVRSTPLRPLQRPSMAKTIGAFFSLYLATLILLLSSGLFNTYLGLRLTELSVSE